MKNVLAVLFLFWLSPGLIADPHCVQLYYDKGGADPSEPYHFGRVHTLFLQNLLGHFPSWQQVVLPVRNYQKGDLERCPVSFYIGTHYQSPVPAAFLQDYVSTKKTVVWMGYPIWSLGEKTLADLWGVQFNGLSVLDSENPDGEGFPGFFRFVDYKGERFEKLALWDKARFPKPIAAFELAKLKRLSPLAKSYELATAVHSVSGETVPYALRHSNHWYIAESPFAFMTEDDRYLVFADLLFDILGEAPRHTGKRPALLRIEDVHPMLPTWQLDRTVDALHKLKAPFAVSFIPHFLDPMGFDSFTPAERDVPITAAPAMAKSLDRAMKLGGSLVLHGYTHQYGKTPNPFSAESGDDFEFWDRVRNKPVAEDSVAWGLDRLEDAIHLTSRANQKFGTGLQPVAWLTPHYQASPLLCALFGRLWTWTIGRNIYFPSKVEGSGLPAGHRMDRSGPAARSARAAALSNLSVRYEPVAQPNGQFFPYEIFGDVYGQRVIPENLGNLQPYLNEQVHKTRSVAKVIAAMKRNRVLRDVWASFFLHPGMTDRREHEGLGAFPGDTKSVEDLVKAAHEYGYEFIDLKTWSQKREPALRPEPLERDR